MSGTAALSGNGKSEGAEALPQAKDVSVVVYVDRHLENAALMYGYVANLLREEGKSFEFIFVDDGNSKQIYVEIEGFHDFLRDIKVIRLPRPYGPAAAMSAGFRRASGDLILTLGPFLQTQPGDIKKMFQKIEEGYDFVNGWRVNRKDSALNQLHTRFFNWLVRRISGANLHDTNCTLKLFRRALVEELPVYGDLYRFLPVLAARRGYFVTEVPVSQRREINRVGVYSLGLYARRLLDLLSLLFIGRFSTTPLRFFGLAGVVLFGAGFLVDLYLTVYKFLGHQDLSDRSLVMLGVLLMVMGVQFASIGLIGELIVFTHARELKDCPVEKILD